MHIWAHFILSNVCQMNMFVKEKVVRIFVIFQLLGGSLSLLVLVQFPDCSESLILAHDN